MGKSKERVSKSQAPREDRDLIPPKYQHLAAVGFLILSLVIFFREPIFEGKVFLAQDNIASMSFTTYLSEANREGVFPLWNPYIFCGMPAYGSLTVTGNRWFDLSYDVFGWILKAANSVLHPSEGWVILYYMIFALAMYLWGWRKLRSKVAATAVALAATYSVWIIVWIMIGHNTKIAAMAMFPLTFLVVELLRDRFRLWLALLLVVLLHFTFVSTHVQMIFYTYLAIGGYLLFFFVRTLIKREDWKAILRTVVVFAAATALAFAMDADRYLSTLEYNPYSIRGSNPIVETAGTAGASKTEGGGLSYDYATSWSLGVGEIFTFLVPSIYGFGNQTYQGVLTNGQPLRINTYFGPQPFTDAAQYAGIVVLVLAVIGFVMNRRDPFVQFMGVLIAFSVLVAFGKELPILYDLMYKYFPTFNKFRVPSMILVLVQIMVALLAGYGIASVLRLRRGSVPPLTMKRWAYGAAGLAALLAIAFVARGAIVGVYKLFISQQSAVQGLAARYGNMQVGAELYRFVVDTVVADVRFEFLFLLIGLGSLYLYLRRSISLSVLTVVLLGAMLADLWRVDTRPMETHEARVQQSRFATPEYVHFLQQDSTLFRVLQFENGQPPYNNQLAYWKIENAYGYHGAKMRSYQDMVEVVGMKNPLLWQLMNVKYIISNRPDSSDYLGLVYSGPEEKVYLYRSRLPRAFFVNRYAVAGGLRILRNIADMTFDAQDVAYFMEDPLLNIDPPHSGATVTITDYKIQELTLEAVATGNNLLFLSETYYPKGWKAFLDGREIPIYRVDYQFRAVVVPPGRHTVVMRFEPQGFYLGRTLSLIVNAAVLFALAVVGIVTLRKTRSGASEPPPTESARG